MRSVLFVDDDQALLRSQARLLGHAYDIGVAESAAAAMNLLESGQRPPVVVTDMRMPGMDGVEFSCAARKVAPEVKILMLTGNQDVTTATTALNKGGVFRFFHKPCPPEELIEGIEDAIRLYDTEQAAKELLKKTFLGAISSISRVAERSDPELTGRAIEYPPLLRQLVKQAGLPSRWEYPVACRLALVGLPGTHDEAKHSLWRGLDPIGENRETFRQAIGEAAEVLGEVPRLDVVGDILRGFPDSDGSLCSRKPKTPGAIIEVGSALVRVTVAAEYARSHGLSVEHTAEEIRSLLPNIDESLFAALRALDEAPTQREVMNTPADQVEMGMVLSSDLCGPSGELLMRSGRRLNGANIDRLREHARSDSHPPVACVTASSYAAFCEAE